MILKRILILFTFFVCSFSLFAQSDQLNEPEDTKEPELETKLVLKFAPLSLVDLYSAFEFALETKVARTSTWQIEAGYINPLLRTTDENWDDFHDMYGYRLRTEYRYYFTLNANRSGGVYFAPEVFFIHVDFDRNTVIGVNVTGQSGHDYYQQVRYDVSKEVFGYHVKMGYQKRVSEILFLDFYAGIGARHVYIDTNKPGVSGQTQVMHKDDNWFYDVYDKGKFYRISASLGFKIGFLLR